MLLCELCIIMSQIVKQVALLAMFGSVATASAEPGNGVSLGNNASLSPAIQLNFVADSNVARAPESLLDRYATDDATDPNIGSPGLEIRPSVSASYDNKGVARLEFGYAQVARVYFLRPDYSYWNDTTLRFSGEFLSESPIGLSVRDSFNFRNFPVPYVDELPATGSGNGLTFNLNNRTFNNFIVEGRYSPGSALDLNLGAYWNLDAQYYQGQVADTGAPKKSEVGGQLKGKWRFFPRTLMLAQLDISRASWANLLTCIKSTDGTNCDVPVEKAANYTQWNFQTGIAGQITNNIQANVFLGYGGLYNDGDVTEDVGGLAGLTGQFQMVYSPTQGHSFSGGYIRRFSDSALMDYILTNSLTAGYNGLYLGNLSVASQLRLDLANYNSAAADESESRNDWTLAGTVNLDYRVTPWLNVNSSFRPSFTTAYRNDASSASFDRANYTISQIQFSIGVRGVY